MHKGWRIINVDESNFRATDNRRHGWLIQGVENLVTHSKRLTKFNIIAGVSNRSEVFYTINYGRTNSISFGHFIWKLVDHLNGEDHRWRENTVLMFDNAMYHRSLYVQERLRLYKVPTLYLGPYHFKLAPVEMFFNFIKNRDLNPLKTKVTTK